MSIACPHCQNTVQDVEVSSGAEVICSACGSSFCVAVGSTVSYAAPPGPRVMGRYQLLGVVGSGAFGTVYKAFDPQLERTVAVKLPRAGMLTGPGDFERFLREARSVAQLQHPGIVPVHEVNQQDGMPYLVSDFVEGVTLADALTGRRLGARESAELIADLAETLHYAHDRGVVHRDVKPSNIMLPRDEGRRIKDDEAGTRSSSFRLHPLLMDFGLAKRDAGEVTMTVSGQVLGTPAYMSPEQARGESHRVDGRSDVYSLGVILYQLLTGELPFRGNTRMLLHQVLNDDPRSVRSLNDKIPLDLETICLRAMAKESDRRYQTAAELAADLRRFLRGEPILARPVSMVERVVRWCGRNRVVASLSVAVAASLLIGALVATALAVIAMGNADREKSARGEADANAIKAKEKEEQAEKYAAQTLEALERFEVANGLRLADSGDLAGALLWFAASLERRATPRTELHRQRFASYWQNVPRPTLLHMFFHQAPLRDIGFSADGQRLLTASSDRTVRVWDVETGQALSPPLVHPREVSAAQMSPDGKVIIASCHDFNLYVWDAVTWRRIAVHEFDQWAGVAISSDSRRFATIGRDKAAHIWDIRTGKRIGKPMQHREICRRVLFSEDGERIATASEDFTARIWDAHTGEPLSKPLHHLGRVDFVRFSRDGRLLVTTSNDKTARLWDGYTGERQGPALPHRWPVLWADFSPAGDRVLTTTEDGMIQIWDTATTQRIGKAMDNGAFLRQAAFSPDGRRVLAAARDNSVRLWDANTGVMLAPPLAHGGEARPLAFHPDGRRFATSSADGTARLWDAASCRPPDPIRQFADVVGTSRNGRYLAAVSEDRRLQIFETLTGKPVGASVPAPGPIQRCELSEDGRRLVSLENGRIRACDMHTGREFTLPARDYELSEMTQARSLSDDSSRLVTFGKNGTVQVWDLQLERLLSEVMPLPGRSIYAAEFTPDARFLTVRSSASGALLWNIADAKPRQTFAHQDRVYTAIFTRDGRRVVTASEDWTARVWDYETGKQIGMPMKHPGSVRHAFFHPDDHHVITFTSDGTSRIWDPLTGRIVRPSIRVPGHTIWRVSFSSDGRQILATDDRFVRLWDVATGQPMTPPLARTPQMREATFLADGLLLTTGADGTARVWDLSVQTPIAEDCVRLARFYHGHRLDKFGGIAPIRLRPYSAEVVTEADEVAESWALLRERFPRNFSVTPEQAHAWRRGEFAACIAERDIQAAVFHAMQAPLLWPELWIGFVVP